MPNLSLFLFRAECFLRHTLCGGDEGRVWDSQLTGLPTKPVYIYRSENLQHSLPFVGAPVSLPSSRGERYWGRENQWISASVCHLVLSAVLRKAVRLDPALPLSPYTRRVRYNSGSRVSISEVTHNLSIPSITLYGCLHGSSPTMSSFQDRALASVIASLRTFTAAPYSCRALSTLDVARRLMYTYYPWKRH